MSGRAGRDAWTAALAAAGFDRHPAGEDGVAGYRRAVRAPWAIAARVVEGGGVLDVGLTLAASPAGTLVGPVHRVLSPAVLASALPHVIASLEALAEAAEALRCPECHALGVLARDADGPFLACGQPGRGRRPFDRSVKRCRRSLVMTSLIVYGEPDPAP